MASAAIAATSDTPAITASFLNLNDRLRFGGSEIPGKQKLHRQLERPAGGIGGFDYIVIGGCLHVHGLLAPFQAGRYPALRARSSARRRGGDSRHSLRLHARYAMSGAPPRWSS